MSDQWALLWSHRQNAVFVQPLEDALSANRASYRDNTPAEDYVPLYVGTREHVAAAACHCAGTLFDRELGIEPLTRQPQEAA